MKTKNKRKTILLLDGNHMLHRGYHAMGNMQFNGKGTGAIFGFLQILHGATARFKPDKIRACFDDGRNPNRLSILPNYKNRVEDREKRKITFDSEDFDRQTRYVLKMMVSLGIPTLRGKGCEADDFIYCLANQYVKKGYKVIICSGDKDFRQMVTKDIFIYDNNKGLITPLNFKKLFVIEPHQYADFLCLDGDTSDKIPGVPGVGPTTAIKLLKQWGSIQQFIGNGANVKDKKYVSIRDTYNINNPLINLKTFHDRFGKQKMVYYKNKRKPKPNLERYSELCGKVGIRKFNTDAFLEFIP